MTDVYNATVSGLATVGDYLLDLGSSIGGFFSELGSDLGGWFGDVGRWFVDLGADLGEWFGDVGSWFAELGKDIGGWLLDLGSSIGGFFGTLGDSLGGWFKSVFKWFGDLFDSMAEMLSYINPFSEKFFLYIAFVPEDGFMMERLEGSKQVLNDRFFFLEQITDSLDAVLERVSEPTWKGLKAEIPLINKEVTVVSPVMVNEASGKIKAWVSGIIIVVMIMYLIKSGGKVIGAGK